jgi:hypothetical protein
MVINRLFLGYQQMIAAPERLMGVPVSPLAAFPQYENLFLILRKCAFPLLLKSDVGSRDCSENV